MSKRIFTKEQIEILLQNKNVAGCSERSISYRKDFKLRAVKEYQEGLPVSLIFKQAGFNIDIIGRKIPKQCLRRWRKIFKEKGETGLKTDNRGKHKSGGRPKGRPLNITNLSNKDKLKRLEAEVAYLKAENSFLAKLRKKSLN